MIGNLLTLITATTAFGAVAVVIQALLFRRAAVVIRAGDHVVRFDAHREV